MTANLRRTFCHLVGVILCIVATASLADPLDQHLAKSFPTQSPIYIGYESVSGANTAHDQKKYLILDFRFVTQPKQPNLQASISKICHTLLHDRGLLKQLDSQGYDMISVAFDRHYQYDCL
ncbi:hypothetical protein [Mangrovitalea sediminis]|uniref:hypothetical protein n=1 Tax=Mangrovitalea sediminis TaxID=1982043 RepID=UPI001D0CF127|nr:hypothetical protein [Mangrovitalea sediminis]